MTNISSLYLHAGGQTPVVTRTLLLLQDEHSFAKISALKVEIGACKISAEPNKSFGDPIHDYRPVITLLARDSDWATEKNHDSSLVAYNSFAQNHFGCPMSDISLPLFIAFITAHHWCNLLQLEGERNVVKRRVITPVDSFNEKLMRAHNAEVLRLANLEANLWAYDFIRQFWDKISTPDKMDCLIKTFRKEA